MRPTWGPPGADRIQVGPMLAPWTLLSGLWIANSEYFEENWPCSKRTTLDWSSCHVPYATSVGQIVFEINGFHVQSWEQGCAISATLNLDHPHLPKWPWHIKWSWSPKAQNTNQISKSWIFTFLIPKVSSCLCCIYIILNMCAFTTCQLLCSPRWAWVVSFLLAWTHFWTNNWVQIIWYMHL